MKLKYALLGAMALGISAAHAQTQVQSTGALSTPPGQVAGAMNQNVFTQNTPTSGMQDGSLNPAVTAAGSTQATATLLNARTNVVSTSATSANGAGVQLPAVARYISVTVMNRSGYSIVVYPPSGATVETALGTAGSVNAGATIANNTDVVFRPISATAWNQ